MSYTLVGVGLALCLLAAVGVGARRLGQSVIPAYLVVGVLVGPYAPRVLGVSFTLVPAPADVSLLADLGVVLLLFFVGVELRIETILARGRRVLVASAVDVVVSVALGYAFGLVMGWGPVASLAAAVITFNSSTVVIAKLVLELGWVVNPESEAILTLVVMEDVASAALLGVLSAVVLGGTATPESVGVSVGLVVVVLGVGAALAYYARPVLQRVFGVDSPELFALAVLGFATVVAGVGPLAGLSEAVAAFLAGVAFGRTDYLDEVERFLGSTRDLFAAVFFFAIGLRTDPRTVVGVLLPICVAVAVTVPGQVVSGYYAGKTLSLAPARALRVGLALIPRGEFSLVVAAFLAASANTPLLRDVLPAFTVGYVFVTSVLGTLGMRHADRVSALLGVQK